MEFTEPSALGVAIIPSISNSRINSMQQIPSWEADSRSTG
jgi:hypothetical protein